MGGGCIFILALKCCFTRKKIPVNKGDLQYVTQPVPLARLQMLM
jgi:hypothetical protein